MILSTRGRLAAVVLATTLTCGAVAGPALAAPASRVSTEAAAAAVAVGDRLEVGGTLKAGEQLVSAASYEGGTYRFVMQTDGNAVVYAPTGGAIWVSNTSGAGNSLTLQRDGNVVIYSAQGAALWASGSAGRGEPAFLAVQNDGNLVSYSAGGAPLWGSRNEDILVSGRSLSGGQALVSGDGRYRAVYQTDGNLVVYGPSGVRWSAATSGGTALTLTDESNLVSTRGGSALWFTGTYVNLGTSQLVMQADGNLVLYSSYGDALWSSDRDGATAGFRDTLTPGQQLDAGKTLNSLNLVFRAVMQADGNVVVYEEGTFYPFWNSGTSGARNRLVMQSDGNAVVYSEAGRALWSSGTGGNPGARLTLQDDGNLVVISAAGSPLWNYRQNGWQFPNLD